MTNLIRPHGGSLVSRIVPPENVQELRRRALTLPTLELTRRELCDLELIATGGFSPLDGFLNREDFVAVVERKRLARGFAWTIPVTLSTSREKASALKEGKYAALAKDGRVVALLEVGDRYEYPREAEAKAVYGTTDASHPGVRAVLERGDVLVGGVVSLLERSFDAPTPAELRETFARRGWRRVAGFQTRNPIHRAHEYLLRVALEGADGLLVHPLVGDTKDDDIPADVRMRAYAALLKYFPTDRVVLAPLPAAMRYAGPREAVHHAIIRQNHGVSHFIVGRDHAGVGKFYGPFDAQKIFDEFTPDELAIEILRFDAAFHCVKCGSVASPKTCPHGAEDRLTLSGTQVRQLLVEGKDLPAEFTRPEVAAVLREHMLCTSTR
jgi:sulfate adenylyltransferase